MRVFIPMIAAVAGLALCSCLTAETASEDRSTTVPEADSPFVVRFTEPEDEFQRYTDLGDLRSATAGVTTGVVDTMELDGDRIALVNIRTGAGVSPPLTTAAVYRQHDHGGWIGRQIQLKQPPEGQRCLWNVAEDCGGFSWDGADHLDEHAVGVVDWLSAGPEHSLRVLVRLPGGEWRAAGELHKFHYTDMVDDVEMLDPDHWRIRLNTDPTLYTLPEQREDENFEPIDSYYFETVDGGESWERLPSEFPP